MRDEDKAKVIQLFKERSMPKTPSRRATPKPSIHVIGDNAQIAGRDINHNHHHYLEKVINKTVVKLEPGIEHITEAQVAELHRLKDEIIRIEKVIKQKPITLWAFGRL